jgi:hypothetical protein
VGFDEHRAGGAEQRRRVGEDAHDIGPALDLLVQPLQWTAGLSARQIELLTGQPREQILDALH